MILPLSAIILLLRQYNSRAFTLVPTTTRAAASYNNNQQRIIPIIQALSSGDSIDDYDDDLAWRAELRERQLSLQQSKSETRQRWFDAKFYAASVGIPDWVRRVSVQWPLAVCGTAGGDIYVLNCESGMVLGKGTASQDQNRYADVPVSRELTTTLKQLFGDYDGGGTLAIGVSSNNVIAHAGRNGGVELWKIDDSDKKNSDFEPDKDGEEKQINDLISQGTLVEDVLVTCLDWAEDDLWIGTQDGRVLVYTIDDEESCLPSEPTYEFNNLRGTILSIRFHQELDVVVAATSSGVVELLAMEEPDCRCSFYPPFDSGRMRSNAFPLCAAIVEEAQPISSSNNERKFAIACGGNDGSVFLQSLRLLEDGTSSTTLDPEINLERPFVDSAVRELLPSHRGPCKCLESPFPGILLSGGQDGTVRVWDLTKHADNTNAAMDDPTSTWALGGFKVWLGSLCTDGEYLVMDGADNAISILNFGETNIEKY